MQVTTVVSRKEGLTLLGLLCAGGLTLMTAVALDEAILAIGLWLFFLLAVGGSGLVATALTLLITSE